MRPMRLVDTTAFFASSGRALQQVQLLGRVIGASAPTPSRPEIILDLIWALPDRSLHALGDAENSQP